MRKLAVGTETTGKYPESQRLRDLHKELTEEAYAIIQKKNHDYTGGGDDPYANFRMANSFGVHPAVGLSLRIGDKLQRISTFANRGKLEVDGEGLRDACTDIINYAILCYGLLTEETTNDGS